MLWGILEQKAQHYDNGEQLFSYRLSFESDNTVNAPQGFCSFFPNQYISAFQLDKDFVASNCGIILIVITIYIIQLSKPLIERNTFPKEFATSPSENKGSFQTSLLLRTPIFSQSLGIITQHFYFLQPDLKFCYSSFEMIFSLLPTINPNQSIPGLLSEHILRIILH